jgi:hypothetical protein
MAVPQLINKAKLTAAIRKGVIDSSVMPLTGKVEQAALSLFDEQIEHFCYEVNQMMILVAEMRHVDISKY